MQDEKNRQQENYSLKRYTNQGLTPQFYFSVHEFLKALEVFEDFPVSCNIIEKLEKIGKYRSEGNGAQGKPFRPIFEIGKSYS